MLRVRPPLLVIAIAAFGPAAAGQATAAIDTAQRATLRSRVEAVDRFVARSRARLGLPGVAVSIASGDSVLLAAGYGGRTAAGNAIDGHTPFYIGSVTKTITAAVVAQLAAEGRLDVDAPIESYLPDFSMKPPFVPRSITVRHLLQHRSGFSQWSGHDGRAQREGQFTHLAPSRPPDARGVYSSLNFIALGRIVEEVSGQSYGLRVNEALLSPLRMRNAFVGTPDSIAARVSLAGGHQSYFGLQIGRGEPDPPRYLIPAGFVAASAADLGRYTGMLIGGGALAGERILTEATVNALLGPVDTAGRAMAWGRSRERGVLVLEHAGNARTSSARVRLVPERGYAIAVLTNTNSGPFFSATGDLMNGIHAILDGEPAPTVWPRERLFKAVLFVSTALTLAQLARRANRWNNAGRPTHIDGSARAIAPLALELVGSTVLVFGIPRYFGVPLGTMHEYFPDLGIALVTTAVAGAAGGVFSTWTRSSTEK